MFVYMCMSENIENGNQGLAFLLKLKCALKCTDMTGKMFTKMERVFAFQLHYIAFQSCFADSIIL